MKQRAVLFLVLICAILAVEGIDCDCDHSKYPKVQTTHYRELGCTPIKDANQCCIERFDCPARNKLDILDLSTIRLPQCEFKNVIYKYHDKIPAELVDAPCSRDCFCDISEITCVRVECAEYFRRRPECILQYRKDGCCASNYVCDEAEKAKLPTCELEGKTYRGGQKMYSNVETCTKCICEEGFDGKLDSKFCHTISCGIELHYGSDLEKGCVPIYYGKEGCCPSDWRCPDSTDEVVFGINKSSEDLALECKFGDLTLTRMDSLTLGKEPCTTCTCVIPPMVSCIKDPVCDQRRST